VREDLALETGGLWRLTSTKRLRTGERKDVGGEEGALRCGEHLEWGGKRYALIGVGGINCRSYEILEGRIRQSLWRGVSEWGKGQALHMDLQEAVGTWKERFYWARVGGPGKIMEVGKKMTARTTGGSNRVAKGTQRGTTFMQEDHRQPEQTSGGLGPVTHLVDGPLQDT